MLKNYLKKFWSHFLKRLYFCGQLAFFRRAFCKCAQFWLFYSNADNKMGLDVRDYITTGLLSFGQEKSLEPLSMIFFFEMWPAWSKKANASSRTLSFWLGFRVRVLNFSSQFMYHIQIFWMFCLPNFAFCTWILGFFRRRPKACFKV